VSEFHAETPQATVSEGLAQDIFVAANLGLEPTTLRTKRRRICRLATTRYNQPWYVRAGLLCLALIRPLTDAIANDEAFIHSVGARCPHNEMRRVALSRCMRIRTRFTRSVGILYSSSNRGQVNIKVR